MKRPSPSLLFYIFFLFLVGNLPAADAQMPENQAKAFHADSEAFHAKDDSLAIFAGQTPAKRPSEEKTARMPWWFWALILFFLSFLIGIVSVLGGVGGGVLFVPIVSGFFPFHVDYVRATGLLLALTGGLSAGPDLLRSGMVNLRLAMPLGLVASASAMAGAMIGLIMPERALHVAMGLLILIVASVMHFSKTEECPHLENQDSLSSWLGFCGIYFEESTNMELRWKATRGPLAFFLFAIVGLIAGIFGLGAGWAAVPILNQVMGVPLKASVATTSFILTLATPSAIWIYLKSGAVLGIIAAPSIIGMMLGARISVRILKKARSKTVRSAVILMLLAAGLRSLLKGFGIWP